MNEHRRIFIEANGSGPWPCYGCGEFVTKLLVHHVDEDHDNNDPSNLVAMHRPCHISLHHKGKSKVLPPFTEEHRRRIGDAHRGMKRSAKSRKRMSDAQRGRKASAETRAKMSVSRTGVKKRQRRFRCGDCDLVTIGSALQVHQRSTGHTGKTEVAN